MSSVMQRRAQVESVGHAGAFRRLGPDFHHRSVIQPRDLRLTSPFVVLVEDHIGPLDDDHMHPHRGFETVTFVLEGEITNVDHSGYRSVTPSGSVQWMTAGSGIIHGGRPHGGVTCRLLQLWLNLPAALRGSAPATREQSRADALQHVAPGARAMIYGEGGRRPGQSAWSRHPMTLTDVELEAGAGFGIEIGPGERMFLYILSGTVVLAGERRLKAGDVAWIALDDAAQVLDVRAVDAARTVAYAARPIDEPSVAHGPFVMTDEAEIRQAYADLDAGRLIAR